MTDSEIVKRWLDSLNSRGKSRHTINAYQRALEHFERWNKNTYGEAFDPVAVIGRDIQDWKAYQQTVENASPATINQRLVALSGFFAWAVRQGTVRSDPTLDVSALRLPKRDIKSLAENDYRRLLRAVHAGGSLRDIAVVELLGGAGLRVGELLALKVGDLEIHDRSGRVTVRKGKHGSYREVPLTRDVRQALDAYLKQHPGKGDPDADLWLGQRGTFKDRSTVLRVLEKYALAARLPAFGPHALRHTFASLYLKANPGDVRGLAALLGHASLNTVMVYTEPRLGDLAERMEKVDRSTSI